MFREYTDQSVPYRELFFKLLETHATEIKKEETCPPQGGRCPTTTDIPFPGAEPPRSPPRANFEGSNVTPQTLLLISSPGWMS